MSDQTVIAPLAPTEAMFKTFNAVYARDNSFHDAWMAACKVAPPDSTIQKLRGLLKASKAKKNELRDAIQRLRKELIKLKAEQEQAETFGYSFEYARACEYVNGQRVYSDWKKTFSPYMPTQSGAVRNIREVVYRPIQTEGKDNE